MSFSRAVVLAATLAAACRQGPADTSVDEMVKTCEGGDLRACQKAMSVLDGQCAQRDAAACAAVAKLSVQGRIGRIDKTKALTAYGRGCEAGDVTACNAAGEGYLNRDRPKAEGYRQKACDLGSGEGCLYLAGYVRERQGDAAGRSEALYRRGVELHLKSCESGDADACFGAGLAISRDDEGRAQQHYRRAVQLWQRQCDALDTSGDNGRGGSAPRAQAAHACYRLGVAYRGEHGVSFDANRAGHMLDRACTAGVLEACAELGDALKESRAASDTARAAQLFERACAAGIERQLPCRRAGFMYAEGDGVPADKPRAATLLEGGCAQDDELCCFKLGTMLKTGDGIPADARRGADLTRSGEGLEFRVVEVRRGTKIVDPGLTAFGLPESSVSPTIAEPGQELILVTMEARRFKETAHLPVRKMYLVDAAGTLYENHSPGDTPFGGKPLEQRQFLFKVPAGMRPLKLRFELGATTLDLPTEKNR